MKCVLRCLLLWLCRIGLLDQFASGFLASDCNARKSQTHGKLLAGPGQSNEALEHFLSLGEGKLNIVSRGTKLSSKCISVNSIIFLADGHPIVVVLEDHERVDVTKLKALSGYDEIEPAPANRVETLCGFTPGSVPPFGHFPNPLQTFVDASLVDKVQQSSGKLSLLGGGGHPYWQSQLSLEDLLETTSAIPGDVIWSGDDDEEGCNTPASAYATATGSELERPAPYFPLSPPCFNIATTIIRNKELSNPFLPVAASIVGRLGKVRQIAKRLVFCDFLPPDDSVQTELINGEKSTPWLSPRDGDSMSVQLIAGKTFCQKYGSVEGEAALRRLCEGQLVMVDVQTNVLSRDSISNWAESRCLDLIVNDYQILDHMDRVSGIRRGTSTEQSWEPPAERPKQDSAQSSLPTLGLHDMSEGGKLSVRFVEDRESLAVMTSDLKSMQQSKAASMVGIDCEWKPSSFLRPGENQPVLVMQVYCHGLDSVYVLDLQSLLRPLLGQNEAMNEMEDAFASVIGSLLVSENVFKVGYQLVADLRRLASSYPHVVAFQHINSVLDISTFTKRVFHITRQKKSRNLTGSLASLVAHFMERGLDKTEQVSDWSQRPLSQSQLDYAALDAVVSAVLAQRALDTIQAYLNPDVPIIERWQGDEGLRKEVVSVRFLFLESEDPRILRKLRAKSVVGGLWIVHQEWLSNTKPPCLPSIPANGGDGSYTDTSGILRIPSNMVSIRRPGDFCKSMVGRVTGRSKDRSLGTFLTDDWTLPDGARLDYPQKSGYVEFKDGIALFVNLPTRSGVSQPRSYPNEWRKNGQVMSWFLRAHEWREGNTDMARKLVGSSSEEAVAPFLLLFARIGKGHFVFCGRCRAFPLFDKSQVDPGRLLEFELQLLDYETFAASDEFFEMVGER